MSTSTSPASQCYSHNGTSSPLGGRTQIPCDPAAVAEGRHSTCCDQGDHCLTNGMCQSRTSRNEGKNYFWRVGCTDPTFQDASCPKFCMHVEPEHDKALIHWCMDLGREEYCCPITGPGGVFDWPRQATINQTCCNDGALRFSIEEPQIYTSARLVVPLATQSASSASEVLRATASTTSDATPTDPTNIGEATSTGLQEQEASSGMSSTTRVGLGVGISLGAVLLAALVAVLVLVRRRRLGRTPSRAAHEPQPSGGDPKHHFRAYFGERSQYAAELPSESKLEELPGERGEPVELEGVSRPIKPTTS